MVEKAEKDTRRVGAGARIFFFGRRCYVINLSNDANADRILFVVFDAFNPASEALFPSEAIASDDQTRCVRSLPGGEVGRWRIVPGLIRTDYMALLRFRECSHVLGRISALVADVVMSRSLAVSG